MVLLATDVLLPSPNVSTEQTAETYNKLDVGARTENSQLKLLGPWEPGRFNGKDNPRKEKQILVDPTSLGEARFNLLMLPPTVTTSDPPAPVLSVKPRLISWSPPDSACSLPRFSFSLLKKRWKNESQASPRQIESLTRRYSAGSSHLALQPDIHHLRRRKSYAERRSFSAADELDFWFNKPNAAEHGSTRHGNSSKPEANKEDSKIVRSIDSNDDSFKCGALCLYLPGFGKAEPVRPKKDEVAAELGNVISRTFSLENFECGSWASSAIINDHEDGDSADLYFDLPLELIRSGVDDATSPVAAASVFGRDRKRVLKNNSTRATPSPRKSHECSRHVRFSTSSPTSYPASPASCITPRLRKAREDFNAFLEAQRA